MPYCPATPPSRSVRGLFRNLALDQQRTLRKRRTIYGHAVWLAAVRLEDEFLIVASNRNPGQALAQYQKRWSIEVLFSALKKRGFDFETTHLTDPVRIKKLVALLALAFTWAHLVGVWLAEQKPLKIKKHGYKEKKSVPLWLGSFAVICCSTYTNAWRNSPTVYGS